MTKLGLQGSSDQDYIFCAFYQLCLVRVGLGSSKRYICKRIGMYCHASIIFDGNEQGIVTCNKSVKDIRGLSCRSCNSNTEPCHGIFSVGWIFRVAVSLTHFLTHMQRYINGKMDSPFNWVLLFRRVTLSRSIESTNTNVAQNVWITSY